MLAYRITLAKFSDTLYASGNPARWNSKDVKLVYTASSRALACLENVVHTDSLAMKNLYKTLVIDIPDISMREISRADLKTGWHLFINTSYTRNIGDAWIKKGESAILMVPSVIIPEEFNLLLNPAHPDFSKIRLLQVEPFQFDPRIKGND